MSSRKSCRRRTLTPKVRELTEEKTNKSVPLKRKLTGEEPSVKRVKSESTQNLKPPSKSEPTLPVVASVVRNDTIDPVEKLLSQTHSNDILYNLDEDSHESDSDVDSLASPSPSYPAYPNLSLNFNKIINENLRSYYLNFRKSHIEIHNDNSSFSILNKKPQEVEERRTYKMPEVPFFRNVNFNPQPSTQTIDDYLHYESYENDEVSSPTDSEHEELPTSPLVALPPVSGKMSFHYRQNNLNLSLSDYPGRDEPEDIFKFLNKRSVLTGKASEMIGTLNFLIRDFFL